MWYFIVIALLASGERTNLKEVYAFPQLSTCVEIRGYVEHNLADLGGFEVTPCKFTPFDDRLELPKQGG